MKLKQRLLLFFNFLRRKKNVKVPLLYTLGLNRSYASLIHGTWFKSLLRTVGNTLFISNLSFKPNPALFRLPKSMGLNLPVLACHLCYMRPHCAYDIANFLIHLEAHLWTLVLLYLAPNCFSTFSPFLGEVGAFLDIARGYCWIYWVFDSAFVNSYSV